MKRTPLKRKTRMRRKSPMRARKKRREAKRRQRVKPLTAAQKRAHYRRHGYECVECGLSCDGVVSLVLEHRDRLADTIEWMTVHGDERWAIVAARAGVSLDVARAVCGQHRTHVAEVDHITPRALGGDNAPTNLRTLCVTCHRAKTGDDAGAIARAPSTRRSQ